MHGFSQKGITPLYDAGATKLLVVQLSLLLRGGGQTR